EPCLLRETERGLRGDLDLALNTSAGATGFSQVKAVMFDGNPERLQLRTQGLACHTQDARGSRLIAPVCSSTQRIKCRSTRAITSWCKFMVPARRLFSTNRVRRSAPWPATWSAISATSRSRRDRRPCAIVSESSCPSERGGEGVGRRLGSRGPDHPGAH